MTILCGTDFTPAAAEAVRVASLWARATREELVLAHALGEASGELRLKLEEQLAIESRQLVEQGAGSRFALGVGPIDAELVRIAQETKASLVVLGALGRRAGGAWKLGSTTDRVAQACRAPVFVVRSAKPVEEWLSMQRTLKVAVAYEASPTGDAALVWANGLSRIAPVELVVLHSYGIHEERQRRGVHGPLSIGSVDARLEEPLAAELRKHILGLALSLRGGLGRPADQLVEMAADAGAELLVVGNHQRAGMERAWKGSVSRSLIELAKSSVVSVSAQTSG
jgi:nucleotide-binding universal stress UspA family protein